MLEQWQRDIIEARIEQGRRVRFAMEVDFRVASKINDAEAVTEIKKLMTRNEATLLALEEELKGA